MISLTDQDLLSRLANTEDSTVERKSSSDYRDCRKTAVAFANSLPIDDPGVIFVGVFDDGRVDGQPNFETLQKKVSAEIERIYPPIFPQMKVLSKDGKNFLAIIVRGSESRPHFAGLSYVRDGTQTVAASEMQFERLLVERNSKAYEIRKSIGQTVTVTVQPREILINGTVRWQSDKRSALSVVDCNQFYVTFENVSQKGDLWSVPLRVIELNRDHQNRRLELRLLEGRIPDRFE